MEALKWKIWIEAKAGVVHTHTHYSRSLFRSWLATLCNWTALFTMYFFLFFCIYFSKTPFQTLPAILNPTSGFSWIARLVFYILLIRHAHIIVSFTEDLHKCPPCYGIRQLKKILRGPQNQDYLTMRITSKWWWPLSLRERGNKLRLKLCQAQV